MTFKSSTIDSIIYLAVFEMTVDQSLFKFSMNAFPRYFTIIVLSCCAHLASAGEELEFEILDYEFTIERFRTVDSSDSNHLILSIAPGYGTDERILAAAIELSTRGIEVWHVDLLENLFIPGSTRAMRKLDGTFIAALLNEAYRLTGRKITLMTRGYGALPALYGARLWQQQHQKTRDVYLMGAILFSPELYGEIPPLGLAPVYDPITTATNIPIMFFQAGKHGNRWQMEKSIERLQQGGAEVYLKILPGVTGLFYHEDIAAETYAALKKLPDEMPRVLGLLEKMRTPVNVAPMTASSPRYTSSGIDFSLKPYQGDTTPLPINLKSAKGETVAINDYTGKVTVVNFWASWCPPCVEEIPALNRLRERMQGKAFELISVNYAESPTQVSEFLSIVDVDFPVLLDEDGSYTAQWNVLVYPSTFIISPEGNIVYGVNGAIEWDSDEVVKDLKALLPP